MPNVAPLVEGSARTLTCVVVIPSMGVRVEVGGGGSGVSDGGRVGVGGSVAVTRGIVGAGCAVGFDPQAAPKIKVASAKINLVFEITNRF